RRAVWGTGGWLPPEEREALDWLTFARLSGWEAKVRTPAEALDGGGHWLVVACDPRQLGAKQTQALRARLETEALLVVMRTPQPVDPLCGLAGASIGGRRH